MKSTESQKKYEELLTPFQMIEFEIHDGLLTRRNRTLAQIKGLLRCEIRI